MTAPRFPIEAGHIMVFARAIGDFNPVYFDPTYAATTDVGGIIAPPTFVQASAQYDPDYPLRPHAGEPWIGSGRTASGKPPRRENGDGNVAAGGTGLHAEQHYEYYRPIRSGEVLTLSARLGETWTKEGRRGGQLQFRETITEFRGSDGELVVIARSIGVRTSQRVERQ